MKLVRAGPVEGHELVQVQQPGLTEEESLRLVVVRQRPPAAQEVMDLRRVRPSGRILDDLVHDVDANAGDPSVEPKPQDVFEGVSDLAVQPVEVRLFGQEQVVVVLIRRLVVRPGVTTEDALLFVGFVTPDVPVATRRLPGGA